MVNPKNKLNFIKNSPQNVQIINNNYSDLKMKFNLLESIKNDLIF